MKKITAMLLTLAMAVTFAGCSGEEGKIPEGMPEPFYNAGVGFVDVLDGVIDVEIDKQSAHDKAEIYTDVMDDYSGLQVNYDKSSEEYEKHLRYSTISLIADSIRWKLNDPFDGYKMEEIIEDRNNFAEYFELESRD